MRNCVLRFVVIERVSRVTLSDTIFTVLIDVCENVTHCPHLSLGDCRWLLCVVG